jgi:osmotically-inducible protein OsmY
MKTDVQLKHDVVAELDWERAINATNVGVAVKDGVVTLSGHIDTYAEKDAIERAVQRVEGVRALAVELDVKLAPGHQRSDSEIAAAAESSFNWHALVPADRIKVRVEKGWVTLSGELDWDYQRRNAESAVRALMGVVGVSNTIVIKPQTAPANVVGRIREALGVEVEGIDLGGVGTVDPDGGGGQVEVADGGDVGLDLGLIAVLVAPDPGPQGPGRR